MDKTIQIFISLKELEMTSKENVSKRLKLVHTETYPASTMYESNKVLNGFLYGGGGLSWFLTWAPASFCRCFFFFFLMGLIWFFCMGHITLRCPACGPYCKINRSHMDPICSLNTGPKWLLQMGLWWTQYYWLCIWVMWA